MELDRPAALRRQCVDVVEFCEALTEEEWSRPSSASGWRVQDVMAHISGTCRAFFTSPVALMTSKDVERTNDAFVDRRRDWTPEQILAEFSQWSKRITTLNTVLTRTPIAKVRVPLGELGKFPVGVMLNSALIFDWHTHLHFDMPPTLSRQAPQADEARMTLVMEWMFAVLGNQLQITRPTCLNRMIALTLSGPGGGTWLIGPNGQICKGEPTEAAARIIGKSEEFPGWGTTRTPWRDADVRLEGDTDYGAAFLDEMNVV